MFLISAFHILKDTTIQLTLEKVPAVEDTQFRSFDAPYHSTGLLRVEGKFVNAVQVRKSKSTLGLFCYKVHSSVPFFMFFLSFYLLGFSL